MKQELVIFGTSFQAELANFYFENDSNYQVVAFTADDSYIDTETFCSKPVVPFSSILELYPPQDFSMFVAIGYANRNRTKEAKYHEIKALGYELATYVSSKATTFSTLKVGDNCFILEDNTIQPYAIIGNNITLWSGNHIGHHSQINDHSFITSHVVISGGVVVGRNCFIGVNSSIRDFVKIADGCVIGAGSWINKDTVENGMYKNKGTAVSEIMELPV